jgi:hypothetical protein
MNPVNILKTGSKFLGGLNGRTSRIKNPNTKTAGGPTKIFYLWEKHGIKRIELFSME